MPTDQPKEQAEGGSSQGAPHQPGYFGIEKYLPLLWFILLAFSLFWVIVVYRSYLWPLFFAILIFIMARPVHNKMINRFPRIRPVAALVTVLFSIGGIILPVTLLVITLVRQSIDLIQSINAYLTDSRIFELAISSSYVSEYFTRDEFWWLELSDKYGQLLGQYTEYLQIGNLSSLLGKTGTLLIGSLSIPLAIVTNFLLMTIILLFLFKDGQRFANFFYSAIPFPDWMEKKVVQKFTADVTAVLKGNFLVAILQGMFVGIAFWISGIPSPLLWGAVGSLVGIIPVVGTHIVFVPGALYLMLAQDQVGWGLFLLIFCETTYQGLDLLLKPKLLDEKLGLHPLVLFLSILGGLTEFGILGVIIGPLIVTLFMTIWEIARFTDKDTFNTEKHPPPPKEDPGS